MPCHMRHFTVSYHISAEKSIGMRTVGRIPPALFSGEDMLRVILQDHLRIGNGQAAVPVDVRCPQLQTGEPAVLAGESFGVGSERELRIQRTDLPVKIHIAAQQSRIDPA